MMSKLAELKTRDTDCNKIETWLNFIGETDAVIRCEIIDGCRKDIETRKYFVKRYTEDCE